MKIRAEINETETETNETKSQFFEKINEIETKTEKINENKRWFSEKIHKIDKILSRSIKKKGRVPKLIKSETKMEKS